MDAETRPLALNEVTLLPPIDRHEVWAAGVTYKRSKTARMEESESPRRSNDRVYDAERPELFFKAHRTASPGLGSRCAFGAIRDGTCRSRNWPWCSTRGSNGLAARSATT